MRTKKIISLLIITSMLFSNIAFAATDNSSKHYLNPSDPGYVGALNDRPSNAPANVQSNPQSPKTEIINTSLQDLNTNSIIKPMTPIGGYWYQNGTHYWADNGKDYLFMSTYYYPGTSLITGNGF